MKRHRMMELYFCSSEAYDPFLPCCVAGRGCRVMSVIREPASRAVGGSEEKNEQDQRVAFSPPDRV